MPTSASTYASTLILNGSARVEGNTAVAVDRLSQLMNSATEVIHLCRLDLRPYSYAGWPSDEFRSVVERMLAHHHIVFATPVYWYAMSGLMKTLFDRFTDLLDDPGSRTLGRSLSGKHVWLLVTGTDDQLPPGFTEPFSRTAAYFDMQWRESIYVRVTKEVPPSAQNLAEVERLALALAGR